MPYMPSIADGHGVHVWSEIGVIFLLFALGLEFSFKKILKMGAAPIIAAIAIILGMMYVGALTGHLFLGCGLAVGAGDADDGDVELATVLARQVLEGLQRVIDHNHLQSLR